MIRLPAIAAPVAALLAALATSPALAAIGDWAEADGVVEARVVASTDAEGNPAAAVEIRLEPGWKAYWRTPGEGGLPTVFDFAGSLNLASASVSYPAPRRYNDGYSTTNVYEGRVLFPIEIAAALASAPVTVHVLIDMGVCETICIPVQLEAAVELQPDAVDAVALALIEEARALLPGAPQPGAFAVTSLTLTATDGTDATFDATVVVPQAFGAELFVEGPAGWYPTAPYQTARDGNRLTFTFAFERPDEAVALAGTAFTFTLVSAGAAIEQTIVLP